MEVTVEVEVVLLVLLLVLVLVLILVLVVVGAGSRRCYFGRWLEEGCAIYFSTRACFLGVGQVGWGGTGFH